VIYRSYQDLEKDFLSGAMHPQDLKKSCAEVMIEILEPVRERMGS